MREIRQSGSEGGAAGVITGRPYPYPAHVVVFARTLDTAPAEMKPR